MIRKPPTKHRGEYRAGLFDNPGQADGGPEARDNPRTRACPTCNARPKQPCTALGGRRQLRDYHPARKDLPADE